jgi:hypothetical protein
MPALTDFAARLKGDPAWRKQYAQQLKQARRIARRMHLIHVSGNPDRVPFCRLLSSPPHEIPTSEEAAGYCSAHTRETEDNFGLPRSVYFYAGRAHYSFGKIALAFAADSEEGREGSATPFDTGGMYKRDLINVNLGDEEFQTLKEFVSASTVTLAEWRKAFARYLAAYFAPPLSYTFGKPCRPDPEGMLLSNGDNWRAWVFEVRFHHQGHSLLKAVAWCASVGQLALIRRELKNNPANPAFRQFFKATHNITPRGTENYCAETENWVRIEAFS